MGSGNPHEAAQWGLQNITQISEGAFGALSAMLRLATPSHEALTNPHVAAARAIVADGGPRAAQFALDNFDLVVRSFGPTQPDN